MENELPRSTKRKTLQNVTEDVQARASLRTKAETAMYEIIRRYEQKHDLTVVRLELETQKRRVLVEAIPNSRPANRNQ